MLSLEELLSNCFFPLFCSNLTAKFDKKQGRFQEINQNLDSPESSWTFLRIRLNIPWNPPNIPQTKWLQRDSNPQSRSS